MMYYLNTRAVPPISKMAIAKYLLLPGIFPMLRNLSRSISRILFMFIQILGAARLIDRNHPCLRPENNGQYRLADVMLLAWQGLKFDRKHIPQIAMYLAVVIAMLLVVGIIVFAGAYLLGNFGSAAHAQYFGMPKDTGISYDAANDWAFQFLERVFGGKAQTGIDFWIPGDSGAGANPWYTAIFVGVLKVYSKALLLVATFIILYLVMIALADSAASGQPFGEKFDSVWAPIRFALAIGMLMPISGSGYNGAQMIAFQSAEWGSNLATNIWHRAIVSMKTVGSDGQPNQFMTAMVYDPGYKYVRDMFLINLCVYGYAQVLADGRIADINGQIDAPKVTVSGDQLLYTFGNKASPDFCGAVEVQDSIDVPSSYAGTGPSGVSRSAGTFFPSKMIDGYKDAAVMFMPEPYGYQMKEVAQRMVKDAFCERNTNYMEMECGKVKCSTLIKGWIYEYWKIALGRDVSNAATDHFMALYQKDVSDYNSWLMDSIEKDAEHGWSSAGAFYMRMTYSLTMMDKALGSYPKVTKLPANFYKTFATPRDPDIENDLASDKCKMDPTLPSCKRYEGSVALSKLLEKGAEFIANGPKQKEDIAAYQKLGGFSYDSALRMTDKEQTGSPGISDVMGGLVTYIYDYFKISSAGIHPLGQVIGWGNTFVNVAAIAVQLAAVLGVVGIFVGSWATALANMAMSVAMLTGPIGFILMFVVPIMPFLYFTFAVIEWVTSIAEAVIGLPLWALSFITLEGDLTGKAMDGVMSMLEIILRPSIIIMSLIASVLVFSAAIGFFNNAIELYMGAYAGATNTLGGVQITEIVPNMMASLGMLIVYMFCVYLMSNACFKLIEVIPNNFGRWIGMDGGFGAQIQMGATGAGIAAGSAIVVNQGLGIVKGALGDAATEGAIRRKAKEYEKDYKEWRAQQVALIDEQNRAAMIENAKIAQENEQRRSRGEEEKPQVPYQRYPERRDSKYFDSLARSGMDFESRKKYWAGGVYGAAASAAHFAGGMPVNGQNTPGSGASGTGSGSNPSANPMGSGAPQNGAGGSGAAPTPPGAGGPIANPGSVLGFSGKAYPKAVVNVALTKMGLTEKSTPQDVKREFESLSNKYDPDKNTHLSLNERLKMDEEFRQIKDAYDVLYDALHINTLK